MADFLTFVGTITSGIGKHVELFVPGAETLSCAPQDWPVNLHPGSLNIRINPNGYPKQFMKSGLANTTLSLDDPTVNCTFRIAQDLLGNNKLTPTPESPERGIGQVWRACITRNDELINCWVLRRIGSGLHDQIEVVSDIHLRETYQFSNGQHVQIHLQP